MLYVSRISSSEDQYIFRHLIIKARLIEQATTTIKLQAAYSAALHGPSPCDIRAGLLEASLPSELEFKSSKLAHATASALN